MSYIAELEAKEATLMSSLNDEENRSLLNKIKLPTKAEDILAHQYEDLDSLSIQDLVLYLGVLSQYHAYITVYVNALNGRRKLAKSFLERKLNTSMFKYSAEMNGKPTLKEKESFAKQKDADLLELEEYVDTIDAKFSVYENVPDTISNLIQTLKKVYDAKKDNRAGAFNA